MSSFVEVSHDGAVQILRLNRPEKKNALSAAMYGALAAALTEASEDGAISCTLLCGQPGIFCAGNDIADFLAAGEGAAPLEAVRFLNELLAHKKPIIAAVDGPAIGIGTTVLFHCDLAYASPRAQFQTPFVNLGLVPEAAASLLAPLIMGHARAFALLALGEAFSAEDARQAGIVNKVVASEEVEAVAVRAAHELAGRPQQALRLTRALLKGNKEPVMRRLEEELVLFAECLKSEEARAAFQRFLAKG